MNQVEREIEAEMIDERRQEAREIISERIMEYLDTLAEFADERQIPGDQSAEQDYNGYWSLDLPLHWFIGCTHENDSIFQLWFFKIFYRKYFETMWNPSFSFPNCPVLVILVF